jgi:hypothetical protein
MPEYRRLTLTTVLLSLSNLPPKRPLQAEAVIREANEAGYRLLEQDDFVMDGKDYFLVFGARALEAKIAQETDCHGRT